MKQAHITPSIKLNEYRTTLEGPGYADKERTMEAGQFIEMETHKDATQLITVYMGMFRVAVVKDCDLDIVVAVPGDKVAIEAGTQHEVSCLRTGTFTSTYIYHK